MGGRGGDGDRRQINEWDLVRLDPRYRPETEITELAYDYREDESLSQVPEDDPVE